MKRLTYTLLFLFTFSFLGGCGGGASDEGKTPVFPASGTVTMKGSPLAGATVAFSPQGDQPTAVATTDDQGNFVLKTYDFGDCAAEGTYKVVVSKSEASSSGGSGGDSDHEAEAESANSHSPAAEKATSELVPKQYTDSSTTPLTAEVKSSGENKFEFKIE